MALGTSRLPSHFREILERIVMDELVTLPNVAEFLCERGAKPVKLSPPIPFHVLTQEDLRHLIKRTLYENGLQEWQPSGWRFLLMRGEGRQHQAVASADVRWDAETMTAHFLQVSCGPGASWLTQAIEQAENFQEVRAHEFELSLLNIPVLSVEALWLQEVSLRRYYMVPVRPTYHGLEAAQLYPAADLLKRLYTVVAEQPWIDNTPDGQAVMATDNGM